jgi:hypothetical protein
MTTAAAAAKPLCWIMIRWANPRRNHSIDAALARPGSELVQPNQGCARSYLLAMAGEPHGSSR